MRTGQLDQRITFYRPTVDTIDASGADVAGTPTNLGEKWANVQYLDGRELEAARAVWAEVRYRITIRRQPGLVLQSDDYIEWNGQTLDIRPAMGPGTRDDFWVILAKDHVE